MTDKHIKDYCKNCKVEPPAMRIKCPECIHNPDNENFAKDINVPSKELLSNEKIINNLMKKVDELKKECEELKKDVDLYRTWYRAKHDDVKNLLGCYRKALEEIEAATKINCEEICGRKFEDCNDIHCFSVEILDIISKAKDGKNDNT